MTLADRIETVLLEQGPLPVCSIAPAVRKQKADVIAALIGNPDRFVHNGLKARASRWDVRQGGADEGFDAPRAAAHFGCTVELATTFLEGFEELGYVARINGNGRFRVTEKGVRESLAMQGVAKASPGQAGCGVAVSSYPGDAMGAGPARPPKGDVLRCFGMGRLHCQAVLERFPTPRFGSALE